MKRLIPLAFLLLLPALSEAQETYSINGNAGQVADLRQHTLAMNRFTCRKWGLAASCTQAQVCVPAGVPGGASCTAAQARNANARIWPDSQAGREEFVTFYWVAPKFLEARATLPSQINEDFCAWWRGLNQTQKDTQCATWGAPAGCEVCQ